MAFLALDVSEKRRNNYQNRGPVTDIMANCEVVEKMLSILGEIYTVMRGYHQCMGVCSV